MRRACYSNLVQWFGVVSLNARHFNFRKGCEQGKQQRPGGGKTSLTCWMATCAVNTHYWVLSARLQMMKNVGLFISDIHILTASVLLGVQDLDLIPNGSNTPVSLALLVMQSERHRLSPQIGYLIVDSTWRIVQISDSRYRYDIV